MEYRPGRFEVVRHVRPAFSCRTCESMTQAPMPSLLIERGRRRSRKAGPGHSCCAAPSAAEHPA
ncbi:MAG: IS66 family transposase zinc-finger binding domain-containing protein [Paracraurococcus sp.]